MGLTATGIKKLKVTGKRYTVSDEKGLCLEVLASGTKSWRFRYWISSKEFRLSLGTYPEISLADARKKRDELRVEIAKGNNPAEIRKEEKALTQGKYHFENIAKEWAQKFSNKWTEGHAELTLRRLELNIFPYLGKEPISQITAQKLLEVLQIIEKRGALEVAKRVRSICSMIFRYAIATGLVDRDPARDLLGALTPPVKKHFATITDPKKVGQLLRDMESCKASFPVYCALQLSPLLFVRPGELRNAEWCEFDFEKKEWRIPAHKMKMRTTHIVPLSRQAMTIFQSLQPLTGNGKYVFPAIRTASRPMSDNTINVALRRIGYEAGEMTGHGFRAMASTLLNEQGWNRDAIERQLGHSERDGVRAAYNYAEFLPDRVKMMQAWADYLDELKK
ncbi:MAG: tyrosine-type recombinase/integrase [Desulfovibrionaceae bacterium]|nr:tyrosine-type recombinase/integrase [Desulfovibrionaceae bacterium]